MRLSANHYRALAAVALAMGVGVCETAGEQVSRPPPVINESFYNYVQSGIVVTVEEKANHISIKVQRAAP